MSTAGNPEDTRAFDVSAFDIIDIEGLSVRAILGIYERERIDRQEVVVDLRLFTDIRAAGASDSIEDAIDYKTLTKAVRKLVAESSYFLVEALATAIADTVLSTTPARAARVRVSKPGALRFADNVAITVLRRREEGAG